MSQRTNHSSKHVIYSKYADERYVNVINEETITIKAKDIYATTLGFGNSAGNSIKSIEFTGGPFIRVNSNIRLSSKLFKIKKILQNNESIEWKSFTIKGEFIR